MIIHYLHAVHFLRNLQVLWDWENLGLPMQNFCANRVTIFLPNLCAVPHDVSFWLWEGGRTFKEEYFLKIWAHLASIQFPSAAMKPHPGMENLENFRDILLHLYVRHVHSSSWLTCFHWVSDFVFIILEKWPLVFQKAASVMIPSQGWASWLCHT